jgi:hypothetical protein
MVKGILQNPKVSSLFNQLFNRIGGLQSISSAGCIRVSKLTRIHTYS